VIALALVLLGMTVVVVLLLLLPLLHGWRPPAARRQFDRAVYRAQLAELERDIARGVIGQAEAQASRLEIERRLLASVTPRGGASGTANELPLDVTPDVSPGLHASVAPGAVTARAGSSRALALATALIIAGGAGLVYLYLGAPGVPDEPFAERQEAAPATPSGDGDMATAAAALAAKLKADPNNPQGWLLYARTEAMLGHWPASADAYERAITLGQNDPDVQAAYGEMLVLAASGIVGPPARAAFASALRQDVKNPVARYYIALEDAQAGQSKRAIAGWQALAADLPEDSPMRQAIGQQIADAATAAGIAEPPLPKGQPAAPASTGSTEPGSTGPGPTPDQVAAAENMSPAERDKMIHGMVDKLAAQVAATPDNLDDWLRLGRAYAVLGDIDKAADAYDHAARLKPGDVDIPLQAIQAMLTGRKPQDGIPPPVVTLLNQVQAASPDRPEVLWYLGVAAIQNGQRDDAKRDWQRLLPLLPADSADHKTVEQALRLLDKS